MVPEVNSRHTEHRRLGPKAGYGTCRGARAPRRLRSRHRWGVGAAAENEWAPVMDGGVCTIRSPLPACRRRVAALMLQFPPHSDPRRRIHWARRPVSTDSRGTAARLGPRQGHGSPPRPTPWTQQPAASSLSRPDGGFCTIRLIATACRRRVAALMLQFPPCSVAGEPLTGARAGPRLADSWAGSRLLGSRPGTCAGAARSKQFRMQFAYLNIQRSPQTLQFQRCKFKAHPSLGGIACEIKGAHQAESHAAPLATMLALSADSHPPATT